MNWSFIGLMEIVDITLVDVYSSLGTIRLTGSSLNKMVQVPINRSGREVRS